MPLRLISSNPALPSALMTTAQHQARVEPSVGPEHVVPMADPLPTTSTEPDKFPLSYASLCLVAELVRAIHDEELLARFT
jgi:hypothetical protein